MAQEDQNSQEPKYLTHEDLNGALAAQKKEFQKLMQSMQEQNATLVNTLKETLGPKQEPLSKKEADDQRLNSLKEQNDILTKRLNERDAKEKLHQKKESVRQALNKAGIVTKADMAIKYLDDQINYNDDDELIMKIDGLETKLSDAIAHFSKTEQGQWLTDAKDIRGSGSRNTNAPATNHSTASGMITGNNGAPVFKDAKSMLDYASGELGKNNLKF